MATVDVTLTRGGDSVTVPLQASPALPLIARDIGKPEAGAANQATLDASWSDQFSQLDSYTITAQIVASDAYTKARDLADFIKSHSGGTATTLSIGLPEYSDVDVAPAAGQDQALKLTYPPGQKDWVGVQLSLTRVGETQGSGTQDASTPTATGSGPITLTDGTNSVELVSGVEVERIVGRPNSVTRRSTGDFPLFIDHREAAYDAFEISCEFADDNATTDASTIVDDLATVRQGRSALTLDFKGVYGMGAFDVVFEGSGALRTVRSSAEEDWISVPTIALRRVTVP